MERRRESDGIMNRSIVLALAWTVACSGTGNSGDDGPPVKVTLVTTAPPLLVGFRRESSTDWQMQDTNGKRTFEFSVTGLYRIVVVCTNSLGGISAGEYARTPMDDPMIRYTCDAYPFTVSGTVTQRGFVGLGGDLATIDAQLGFQLRATAGSFDLVHLFRGSSRLVERIGIRRDVEIMGNTDLGLIDLTGSSQALVEQSYTLTNLASETVFASTRLYSGNSIVSVATLGPYAAAGNFQLAPEGMLRATDRQVLNLRACAFVSGANRDRVLRRTIHAGDPAMFTLPDSVGQVTFTSTGDRLEATASSLPDHDRVFLSRQSNVVGTNINFHGIVVSRTFNEASGNATMVLDLSDVPGFRSSWGTDSATQHSELVAYRGSSTDDVMTSSSVFQAASAIVTRPGSGRIRAAFSPEGTVELLDE
jgi:hypothetical protein